MEAVIEHTLEPELAGPVPRRLHLPLRARLLLTVAGLLLGLFVAGSARALWEGVKLSWLAEAGRPLSGQIVEIRTEASAPKGRQPRQTAIRYSVALPGRAALPGTRGRDTQTGWIVLSEPPASLSGENRPRPALPLFQVGQPFPLRLAFFGNAMLCQPWGPNVGSRIWTLFLSGGLVLAVSLLLLRRLLGWTGSRLHLLRFGTATVGTITHKRSESEDMVRYFLRYGYPGGPDAGREEQVSADQWRLFQVGQPVTVLFNPGAPEKAGLYALIARM